MVWGERDDWSPGSECGDAVGGGSGLGEGQDGLGTEGVGGTCGIEGDDRIDLGVSAFFVDDSHSAVAEHFGVEVSFGHFGDARHEFDGCNGVVADRGFGGEHNGIRAVADGVVDVSGFGARGVGVVAHGLEHLGCGDDGFADFVGHSDHAFLGRRDEVQGHLDTEIAAGDHDDVGFVKNLVQVVDGFFDFDLCDQYWVASGVG